MDKQGVIQKLRDLGFGASSFNTELSDRARRDRSRDRLLPDGQQMRSLALDLVADPSLVADEFTELRLQLQADQAPPAWFDDMARELTVPGWEIIDELIAARQRIRRRAMSS